MFFSYFLFFLLIFSSFVECYKNENKIVYRDEKYQIRDYIAINGLYIRLFATNEVIQDDFGHGFILLNNIDRIVPTYTKLMMGSLILQPMTRRVLLIGLGVGVLARSIHTALTKNSGFSHICFFRRKIFLKIFLENPTLYQKP